MEDEIDLLFGQEDKIGNVVPDEAIIFVPCQMPDICHIPGDQIVDRDDAMPFGQESIHQMRAEKTRTAGHDGNELGIFGHGGLVLIAAPEVYQQEVIEE